MAEFVSGWPANRFNGRVKFTWRRFRWPVAAAMAAGWVCIVAIGIAPGCRRGEPAPENTVRSPVAVVAPHQTWMRSNECRECHKEIFEAWSTSHHALAHRPVDAGSDAGAFQPSRRFHKEGIDYHVAWEDDRPAFHETRENFPDDRYTADFVMGHTPLRQYIVPADDGRHQAAEIAFDPARNEWFDVFGAEQRRPGEWGHWRGRGMNWNSMCAHCHMTGFQKNYRAETDTYATAWLEHGVGCVQCHGGITPEHRIPTYQTPRTAGAPLHLDRQRMQETCAPCHARNELLAGDLEPGARYGDRHRLTLPVDSAVFYPDGQVRDEDYNYTSLLLSRMGGKAGVTCLDCHDGHTGKTRLPAANNAICMQCHAPPGRLDAPVIDPTAHSRHAADSTGNRCIECHMPKTTYMQRDPRRDHGFLIPDPLLTRELGIPNACNRCHADKSVDWAIEAADRWYGSRLDSRQRTRARAVDAAQNGDPDAAAGLLALLVTEEIPAWKASLLQIGAPYASDQRMVDAAVTALADSDPMVRSAAVQVLAPLPAERSRLRPMLRDLSKLVRLDAAWALSAELPEDSPERRELDAYLALNADQPAGQLRIGQDFFNRGRTAAAEQPLRKALAWDPYSPPIYEALGIVLDALGRSTDAAAVLWRGAQMIPLQAELAYQAGLAFAAAGKPADAELALREATRRDPRFHRAWYNLGLLLARTGRPQEALEALEKAEMIAPDAADYPYARATILLQMGDRAGAIEAAQRALTIDPRHAPARELMGGL